MIEPTAFLDTIIDPTLSGLTGIMGSDMASDEARIMLLAIALQESGLEHRRQISSTGDPMEQYARGWWQFEQGGGVAGVCGHVASSDAAEATCAILHVPFTSSDIHQAIAWHDHLAASFARLLLYTDAAPLPAIGAVQTAWDYYIRNWRPGKPHPETWPANYQLAVATVNATKHRQELV